VPSVPIGYDGPVHRAGRRLGRRRRAVYRVLAFNLFNNNNNNNNKQICIAP